MNIIITAFMIPVILISGISISLVMNQDILSSASEATDKTTDAYNEAIYEYEEDLYQEDNRTASQMIQNLEIETEGMEKNSFNGQFIPYQGERRTASQVKTLFSMINASNVMNVQHITINSGMGCITSLEQVNNGDLYDIVLEYDNSGYVSKVTITKHI